MAMESFLPRCSSAPSFHKWHVLHFLHSIIRHSPHCPKLLFYKIDNEGICPINHAMPTTDHSEVNQFSNTNANAIPWLILLNTCCLNGFAFVYFDDERDAEDAISRLDNTPFGYSKRRISVEWARQGERGGPRRHGGSKSMANQKPTKTLFVINFDPESTRIRDIEKHYESYGKVLHVRIRRNFAFVQFETQEDATKALEGTHMSKILDRVVSVEYALRDDREQSDRRSSPRRAGYGRRRESPYGGRSISPVQRRSRPSPDYGRARSRSPAYDRNRSPDYGRYPSRSPVRSPVRRSRT